MIECLNLIDVSYLIFCVILILHLVYFIVWLFLRSVLLGSVSDGYLPTAFKNVGK